MIEIPSVAKPALFKDVPSQPSFVLVPGRLGETKAILRTWREKDPGVFEDILIDLETGHPHDEEIDGGAPVIWWPWVET